MKIIEVPSPDNKGLRLASEELPFPEEDIRASDEMRLHLAKKFGLPNTASWEEVDDKRDELDTQKVALALGLDKNATIKETTDEERRQGIYGKSYLLMLGLQADATPEQIEQAKNEKRAGELEMLHEVAEDMRVNRAKNITPKDSPK